MEYLKRQDQNLVELPAPNLSKMTQHLQIYLKHRDTKQVATCLGNLLYPLMLNPQTAALYSSDIETLLDIVLILSDAKDMSHFAPPPPKCN